MMVITTSAGLAIIIIRDSHCLHVHLHLHAHLNIYIHSWRACLYVFLDYFNYDGNISYNVAYNIYKCFYYYY